jgi:hypothetical protein
MVPAEDAGANAAEEQDLHIASGPDMPAVQPVADALRSYGLEPLLDRETLAAGDSFLAYMEDALSTSD